jgi:hypothetical protein
VYLLLEFIWSIISVYVIQKCTSSSIHYFLNLSVLCICLYAYTYRDIHIYSYMHMFIYIYYQFTVAGALATTQVAMGEGLAGLAEVLENVHINWSELIGRASER